MFFWDLNSEDIPDVLNPLLPPLIGGNSESPRDKLLFLCLDLQHLLLDGVLSDELVNGHVLGLP